MNNMLKKQSASSNLMKQIHYLFKFSHFKFTNLIAIFICIIIIIFLNSPNKFSNYIYWGLFEINSNVIKLLNIPVEISSLAKEYVDEKLYLKEIKLLKEQNRILQDTILTLKADNNEIVYLKELLNYSLSTDYKLVTTKLLRSSMDISSQEFSIPIGSNQGINLSGFVVSGKGLIGKIIESGYDISKVKLITNINSKTPIIFSQSREKAILIGTSTMDNNLNILYCTNIDKVNDGDLAVTSGDGSIYPPGIVVGQFVKADNKGHVQTTFLTDKLEFVKVYAK